MQLNFHAVVNLASGIILDDITSINEDELIYDTFIPIRAVAMSLNVGSPIETIEQYTFGAFKINKIDEAPFFTVSFYTFGKNGYINELTNAMDILEDPLLPVHSIEAINERITLNFEESAWWADIFDVSTIMFHQQGTRSMKGCSYIKQTSVRDTSNDS